MLLFSLIILCRCSDYSHMEQEKIIKIEKNRLQALVNADTVFAAPIHSYDFQLITPMGYKVDKNEYLRSIESGELDYKEWGFKDISVRFYKHAAVMRYTDTVFVVYLNGELLSNVVCTHTNLYEKHDGQWLIIWSQASGK